MDQIKVIVADDHILFREGIVSIIKNFENVEVVGQADNGRELINSLKYLQPHIILLDLKMPLMDGIEALPIIKEKYPLIKVIPLTMHDEEGFIIHLIEQGANGYLLKNTGSKELEDTIRAVMKNDCYFNEKIQSIIRKKLTQKVNKPSFSIRFSDRELEVLKLLCKELSNEEIGNKMFLSPRTIEGYRQRLLKKTDSKGIAGLVLFAVKHGYVDK